MIGGLTVHNSANQEMDLLSRFKIDETRNGRAKVEMFNLIVMSEAFQEWFLEEFQCHLPLPLLKKTGTEPQNFVAPASNVTLIFPVPVINAAVPVINAAVVPVEAHPVSLEERVQRLEEWMGRFNIHFERLMQNKNDNGHLP